LSPIEFDRKVSSESEGSNESHGVWECVRYLDLFGFLRWDNKMEHYGMNDEIVSERWEGRHVWALIGSGRKGKGWCVLQERLELTEK